MNKKQKLNVAKKSTLSKRERIFILLKIQLGDFVTGVSGKQGNTVYSKNHYGFYKRGVGAVVNPQTAKQEVIRERFSSNASRWRTLTQAQRDSWITLAPTYTRINVFGDNKPLSPSVLYQRLNSNLLKIVQPVIAVCPVPEVPASIAITSLTPGVGAAAIDLVLASAVPAGFTGYLMASPVMSAGIRFNRNRYKFIKNVVNADTATIDIKSEYEAVYGTSWTTSIGAQIMLKLTIVENATGLPSAESKNFGLIVA